ncbi:hypothetical protein Dimus_019892 [Dionaea muscipula]
MGNNQVLLTFPTKDKMDSFFENHNNLGSHWFSSVSTWSVDLVSNFGREVWLCCYGVPIHAWNASTFSTIGQCWGEVIQIEEDTVKSARFDVGEVKIFTTHSLGINNQMKLMVGLLSFNIRVAEEQATFICNSDFQCQCICHSLDKSMEGSGKSSTGDVVHTKPIGRNGNKVSISPSISNRSDGPLPDQHRDALSDGLENHAIERSVVQQSGREVDVDNGRIERVAGFDGDCSVSFNINEACIESCDERLRGENSEHRDDERSKSPKEEVPQPVTNIEIASEHLGREEVDDCGVERNWIQTTECLDSKRPNSGDPIRTGEEDQPNFTQSPSRVDESDCDAMIRRTGIEEQLQRGMTKMGDGVFKDCYRLKISQAIPPKA